jgi:hypothetical protein
MPNEGNSFTHYVISNEVVLGELPALKLCRHYTILKQDMDAFLDRHRAALMDKDRAALAQSAKCQRSSPSF